MINLNAFGQCSEDIIGTGIGECPFTSYGDLLGLGLLKKGTKLDIATDTFDETAFRALITSGKLHQVVNSYAFEDTTPESEKSTSSTGLMESVRAGKPMYNFTFKKGAGFHRAVYSLKGQNRWDSMLYFTEGILVAHNVGKTEIKGFSGGMFDVDSYKFTVGAETEFSKASLQLTSAEEFNTRFTFFPYSELGFNALEIDGVVQTNVAYDTIPASGDTFVSFAIVDSNNTSISYSSLFDEVGDWKLTVNGIDKVITSVAVSGNLVDLDFTGALTVGQVVKVSLNGIVADDEMKYYKSNTVEAVAV
jgi:hypothetical protein